MNSQATTSFYLSSIAFFGTSLNIARIHIKFIRIDSATWTSKSQYGGGIYCESCTAFTLSDSVFKNTNAGSGGALYLSQTYSDKASSS